MSCKKYEIENSELEEFYLEVFRRFYPSFPNGEIVHSDKPDYIIDTGDKKIGIEITKFFVDNIDGKASKKKRLEILHNCLGEKLRKELESIVPFKFVLSVQFSKFDFSKNEVEPIVRKCVNHIKTIRSLDRFDSIAVENEGDLPKEISSFEVKYAPSYSKSLYAYTDSAILPDLSLELIQNILDNKHKKLINYQECNEHWLLIVEDGFYSSRFGENYIESLESDFDKVFLLRISKEEKIIELK